MHTADPFDTPANRMSMYWATLRRRWRLAAAILAVAVVTGVAVGMLMPNSYQATAKVLIGQRAQLDALLGAADYVPDPEREVNTNLALISLEPVAEDVRRRLGLRAGTRRAARQAERGDRPQLERRLDHRAGRLSAGGRRGSPTRSR